MWFIKYENARIFPCDSKLKKKNDAMEDRSRSIHMISVKVAVELLRNWRA